MIQRAHLPSTHTKPQLETLRGCRPLHAAAVTCGPGRRARPRAVHARRLSDCAQNRLALWPVWGVCASQLININPTVPLLLPYLTFRLLLFYLFYQASLKGS